MGGPGMRTVSCPDGGQNYPSERRVGPTPANAQGTCGEKKKGAKVGVYGTGTRGAPQRSA